MAKVRYSAIGLDIASSNIKLLQLKEQGNSITVYQAAEVQMDENGYKQGYDEKLLANKVAELLSKVKLKGKNTMLALPAQLITTAPIKLVLKDGLNLEQTLIHEAGNYLPFPIQEAIIDYLDLPLGDQRSQRSVLLMAIRKEELWPYLRLLDRAGMDVVAVEPRYCSLFRAIRWVQGKDFSDEFIFYLGENNTILMILVDKQILVVRQIPWGIKAIKSKMEKALGMSEKMVEKVLYRYGVGPYLEDKTGFREGDATLNEQGEAGEDSGLGLLEIRELYQVIYEVVNPILEELCLEAQRVLSYCVSIVQQRVIDKALLLGKGAKIKYLPQVIQQKIGFQVLPWDSLEPFFEVSLGLALREGFNHGGGSE